MMYPNSPIWIAWAAGVLEQGRFLDKHGRMTLRLTSENGELIERFHQTVKVGNTSSHAKRNFAKKPLYVYVWSTDTLDEAVDLIDLLLPFMTRKQADHYVGLRVKITGSDQWQANS